jgi:hypothetical protein
VSRATPAATDGPRFRVTLLALFAAVGAALVLAASASAATKPFSLVIQPAAVPAGTATVSMTATFTNENKVGTGINLGSANLTPPANFTVQSASVSGVAPFVCPAGCTASVVGNVVELRGIAVPPGSSVRVSMVVSTPPQARTPPFLCTVALPCAWSVLAKQSNDFSGPPGNDLNPDPATSALNTVLGELQFSPSAQPHSTTLGQAITDSDYNPPPPTGTGGPVLVQVVDATGAVVTAYSGTVTLTLNTPNNSFTNPFPATLSGTTQVGSGVAQNAVAGVATFKDLMVSEAGNGYTLFAQTSDMPPLSVTSDPFNVQQDGTQCTTKQSCHTEAKSVASTTTNGGVDATVTASAGQTTDMAESLDFGVHMSAAQCEGYDAAHDVYWNLDPASGRIALVSITTTVLSGQITGSMIKGQDSCLAAPKEFTEENESTTPSSLTPAPPATLPDGSPGFSGLLPDCGSKKGEVPAASNPCVLSRTGTSNPGGGGTLTLVTSVPASFGDITNRG